jgi:hypothetical protein
MPCAVLLFNRNFGKKGTHNQTKAGTVYSKNKLDKKFENQAFSVKGALQFLLLLSVLYASFSCKFIHTDSHAVRSLQCSNKKPAERRAVFLFERFGQAGFFAFWDKFTSHNNDIYKYSLCFSFFRGKKQGTPARYFYSYDFLYFALQAKLGSFDILDIQSIF